MSKINDCAGEPALRMLLSSCCCCCCRRQRKWSVGLLGITDSWQGQICAMPLTVDKPQEDRTGQDTNHRTGQGTEIRTAGRTSEGFQGCQAHH